MKLGCTSSQAELSMNLMGTTEQTLNVSRETSSRNQMLHICYCTSINSYINRIYEYIYIYIPAISCPKLIKIHGLLLCIQASHTTSWNADQDMKRKAHEHPGGTNYTTTSSTCVGQRWSKSIHTISDQNTWNVSARSSQVFWMTCATYFFVTIH